MSNQLLRALLTQNDSMNLKAFEYILKKCPKIQSINYSFGRICDEMIDLIIIHCQHLNEMDVRLNSDMNPQKVEQLFSKFCKQLKTLRIRGFYSEPIEDSIDESVINCKNISEMTFV